VLFIDNYDLILLLEVYFVKAHLVNCLSMLELERFINEGYVGLGPFPPKPGTTTRRQVSSRIRITWDVIADLKRVRPGDMLFLHSEGYLLGPLIFESTFYESENMPSIMRSTNMTVGLWFSQLSSFNTLNFDDYGYVASIAKPMGYTGIRVDIMELFLRQSIGTFNGVPPRFQYGDTRKIVKPLLPHDSVQLLELVQFTGNWSVKSSSNFDTTNLEEIILDLRDYGGHLFAEKILEAWFMENMHPNAPGYKMVCSILGEFNFYANSIYTYYTNFLDVFACNSRKAIELSYCPNCHAMLKDLITKIKIIELKRDTIDNYNSIQRQIRSYQRWAHSVLNPNAEIEGFIVAAGFTTHFRDEAQKNNLQLIQYYFDGGTIKVRKI
jgi:hypothetical protein